MKLNWRVKMGMKNPTIKVSFEKEDFEIIQKLSEQKKLSMSCVIHEIVHQWLEEYEDILLLQKLETVEKNIVEFISHDELWKSSKQKQKITKI